MPITDDDAYERYRDAAAARGPWPRPLRGHDNGDNARNQMRSRIERLPSWMRSIELMAWSTGCPGGGT